MIKKQTGSKQQAGVTLLEVLAYLGIAAVILIGAISMFGSAQGSAQSNDLTAQIVGLRSGVKAISAGQGTYGTGVPPGGPLAMGAPTKGLNQMLIQGNAVPSSLRSIKVAPWTISNSFGGEVSIDGNASQFWIHYTNVPQEVCVKVAPQNSSGWQGISVNGTLYLVDTGSGWITPAQAAADCTPGSTNTILWRAH